MASLVNAQNIRGVYYTGAGVTWSRSTTSPSRSTRASARSGRRVRQWQDHPRLDHLADRATPLHVEHGTLAIDGKVAAARRHARSPAPGGVRSCRCSRRER